MRHGASTRTGGRGVVVLAGVGAFFLAGLGVAVLALLTSVFGAPGDRCGSPAGAAQAVGPGGGIVLAPPGTGQVVGATEYGGPGDPSSGVVGSSGANLLDSPDSYAELGGTTFQTATAMGGLPYLTPLRITWGEHSAIAYKRDIGLGGSPIDGLPRVVDLWWELAGRLGIPYDDGLWSGPVQIARPPAAGAGNLLGQATPAIDALIPPNPAAEDPGACVPTAVEGVPATTGDHAQLLSDGLAAAPTDAPPAVQAIIAAGNQIASKPYVLGGGHGKWNDVGYDCSGSVSYALHGGGLLSSPLDSSEFMSWGAAGKGRWITIYANPGHAYMIVAGRRFDTSGQSQDGSRWHTTMRSSAGYTVRHPPGF
jgi:hypothetical protein